MTDQLRNVYVTELAENTRHLTGSRFEEFCYCIMGAIQPGQWTHRGTTSEGAPVGYVVDSSAYGARWVAQYSSEKGYFDGNLDKLNKDLASTTAKHPQVTHLWMFSNDERGPGQTTAVQNWINTQAQAGRTVRVLDVRDIATAIYEKLDNDQLVEAASPFLPYLSKARDMWALSHKVPSFPNYVSRDTEEAALKKALRDQRIAVASGMSGCGKSAIASAVATKLRRKFDSVFWLDASTIKSVDDLKQFDALQNGQKYNILGVAKRSSCLLVLDDLKIELSKESVLQQLGAGSAALITTQFTLAGAIDVSGVEEAAARQILEAGIATACPCDCLSEILSSTSGHPLLLSSLNRIASETTPANWAQVRELCASPTDVEDNKHSPLHDRILHHHLDAARLPIAAIAWLGSPGYYPRVLSVLAGPNAERVLRSRNLLTAAAPGLGRVHDLAFSAIARVVSISAAEASRLRIAFCDYLAGCIARERVELHRIATVHRSLARRLLQQETHPALRYVYALPRSPDTDLALLGEPTAIASQYRQHGAASELDVWALIECIEARFSIANRKSKDSGQASLLADAPALDAVAEVQSLADALQQDIAHHQAKLLLWQGKSPEAESRFSELISRKPKHSAARLQLGRLLAKKKPPDVAGAITQAEAILDLPEDSRASDTVALGAFSLLRGDRGRVILKNRAEQFATLLSRAASVGLDQAFDVLAELAGDLWYQEPDLLQQLSEALPSRLVAPSSDKDWFAWAQLRKALAKTRLEGDALLAEVRPLLDEARESYAAMKSPNHFHLVQASECSILLSEPFDALALLEKVDGPKREANWHHRRAQALRLSERFDEALEEIEQSINDPSAKKFVAAFLEERWKIKKAKGDGDAVESLRQAVAASDAESKFGRALRARLSEVEA